MRRARTHHPIMNEVRHKTRYPSPWAWQAHGFVILFSLTCVVLAAPFAARPFDLPLPVARPSRIEAHLRAQRVLALKLEPELAREASEGVGGPHFDLRALGTAIRAYGRAEVADDRSTVVSARAKVLAAAAQARRTALSDLPAFRAYQAELFLHGLRRWEREGVRSTDLEELGGVFLDAASRHGWIGEGRELLMNDAMRTLFFERRWNEVTGLFEPDLLLSLDETRAFYAFLLAPRRRISQGRDRVALGRDEDEWRLRKVDELERFDPDYPAGLARGILLYRLGRFAPAERALAQHVETFPEGAHAVLARNAWLAARARVTAGD